MKLDLIIKNDDGITTYKDIEYKKKNNKILFETKDDKYEFEIDKDVTMKKENSDSSISILFQNKKKSCGLYEIYSVNNTFNLNIYTNNIEINEKSVIIDYELYIEDEKTGNFRIEIYLGGKE